MSPPRYCQQTSGTALAQGPPQTAGHRVGVAVLDCQFVLAAGGAADLELPLAAVSAGDHAVHQDARITHQVSGLLRLPQHGKPQDAVQHEGLYRADPGRAVTADRRPSRTPGSSSRRRPSPARRGWQVSISDQSTSTPITGTNAPPPTYRSLPTVHDPPEAADENPAGP